MIRSSGARIKEQSTLLPHYLGNDGYLLVQVLMVYVAQVLAIQKDLTALHQCKFILSSQLQAECVGDYAICVHNVDRPTELLPMVLDLTGNPT